MVVHVFVRALQLFAPQRSASVSAVHATQVPLSQSGVAPKRAQSACEVQTPHVAVAALQDGAVGSEQSVVSRHPTQTSAATSHFGESPSQWASRVHATHVRVAALHAGVSPLQFASETQPTQRPVWLSQIGVAPLHVARHSATAPSIASTQRPSDSTVPSGHVGSTQAPRATASAERRMRNGYSRWFLVMAVIASSDMWVGSCAQSRQHALNRESELST